MTKTKIEWATDVWNPTVGCTKVSAGCKNCYAERIFERFHVNEKFTSYVRLFPDRMDQPVHWKKPRRVFVDSMSDLFHKDVPSLFIDHVFEIMHLTYWHTFIILTKRPKRMFDYISQRYIPNQRAVLPNVWLGVSVEDQKTADERIPILLQTPAAVRFVSVEPMLEPINIINALGEPDDEDWDLVNSIQDGNDDIEPEEYIEECEAECDWVNFGDDMVVNPEWQDWANWRKLRAGLNKFSRELDWVICGCESGPRARPMELDWARSLRDQCQEAGVPFFLKQANIDGKLVKMPNLDGKIWDELPEKR